MLAKNPKAPLGIWFYALSFTTIVGTPPEHARSYRRSAAFQAEIGHDVGAGIVAIAAIGVMILPQTVGAAFCHPSTSHRVVSARAPVCFSRRTVRCQLPFSQTIGTTFGQLPFLQAISATFSDLILLEPLAHRRQPVVFP